MDHLSQQIPKDKYSTELKIHLFKLWRNNLADKKINNLYQLVNCGLADDCFKNLLENNDYILPEIQIENIEITARVNDIKFILGDKDRLNCIKRAVESYIKIYEKTDELNYLIRALELVGKAKSIFKQELVQLEGKILQVIVELKSSYYQLQLLNTSINFLFQEASSKKLIDYFTIKLEESFKINQYDNAIHYIQILSKLKYFNDTQFKIETALCLEKEADYYVSQIDKDTITYNPKILSSYLDALRQIKKVVVDENFKTRLEKKIKNEQKVEAEIIPIIGINGKSKLNIPQLIREQNIEDFDSGFDFLLWYPIFNPTFNKKQEKDFFFQQYFPTSLQITNKGTVSGISSAEEYNLNQEREHYRNITISLIQEIKLIMDLDGQVCRDWVVAMISQCKSPLIPKDREYLFIEGIYSGFQNNFILSSHLLIPQIENSLKSIIESNNRNTIKLLEDIQNDNTLGGLLSIKENGKMLDGICEKNLLLELNSFLIDGNSVNFRNKISHGLISPFEINYYGIYLWWLSLKMIVQTEEYFKTVITNI
ncbi:DUF4209 domain-containing protein [Chryseobacterium sp. JM1]|uniref:DUF4209 domain-containing protein n=1 Tax=Chryseobacterium sp. JM1 TaxID=1233950 RepID=UPI0004E7BD53|nr:DUF4209 domain-containing protein [Chryseobacterium sp. JM1]KFF21978.1 hypothetical protein IW22_08635 [Chryseobacterium sp. JM1]